MRINKKITFFILASIVILLTFTIKSVDLTKRKQENINPNINTQDLNINTERKFDKFAYSISLEKNGYINSSLFIENFKSDNTPRKLMVDSQLTGLLNIKLINRDKGKSLFFALFSQLENKQVFSNKSGDDLLSPFAFYLNENGSLSLAQENIDYNNKIKNLALSILPYLQVVGFSDSHKAWKTREIDPLGRYKSEYIIEHLDTALTIVKHKLVYDRLNKLPALFNTADISVQAKIVHHKSTIKLGANSVWATNVELSERVIVNSGEKIVSDIPIHFSALVAKFDPKITMPDTFDELTRLLAINKRHVIDYYKTDKNLSALVIDKDIGDVFELYYELALKDKFLAKDMIVNYLRLYPELSIEFVNKIYSEMDKLSSKEEVRLWHALAKAGHKEAQNAYIYALENKNFKQMVQYRAIGHIRVFEQPSKDFIEKLWGIEKNITNSIDGNSSDRRALAKGVLFAIATLSSGEFIDKDVQDEILQTLKDKIYFAIDDVEKLNLIIAAGNTKSAILLDSVSPYLNSDNITLKSKAFKALSNMPHDDVIETYLNAYEQIDLNDRQMQFQALKGLKEMELTENSIKWVSERALQLNNKTETKRFINMLGANLSSSMIAESTLRALLTTDISPELKSDIYAFIAP